MSALSIISNFLQFKRGLIILGRKRKKILGEGVTLLSLITQGYFCQTNFIKNHLIFKDNYAWNAALRLTVESLKFMVTQCLCILWGPSLVYPKNFCRHQYVNQWYLWKLTPSKVNDSIVFEPLIWDELITK